MAKVHIDENVSIKTDKAAEEALAKQSDVKFLESDGVVQISEDRWTLAQKAESKHWMRLGRGASDDRNYDHARFFGNYKELKGKTFNKAIEFGCGPFTNLRVIGNISDIKSCLLLDPLADTYLRHSHCKYKNRKVLQVDGGNKVPCTIMSIPGEKAPDGLNCDLVVCVNVLEHCYDARVFYEKLWDACAPGGYIVFHDKLFTYEKAKKSVEDVYDAAHPLRIGKDLTINFLHKFTPKHELWQGHRNDMIDATQDLFYFIGKKE